MPQPTDNELRALAYYAIGVGSEGKDEAYRLSFAGKAIHEKNGAHELRPIGNSGYSLGEMQTDLGQHRDAADGLVAGFNAWAKSAHPDWALSAADQAQLAADLGRDGRHIRDPDYDAHNHAYRAQHHAQIPSHLLPSAGRDIDPTVKSRLDAYLATAPGQAFVDAQDQARVDRLMKYVAEPLAATHLYQTATPDEQAKLFAVTAKVYNQSHTLGREILDDIGGNHLNSLATISARIDAFHDGKTHYMRTGRDAALAGAEVFNALQATGKDHPLHETWQVALAGLDTSAVQPHLADEKATAQALFTEQSHGKGFIQALAAGEAYSHGNPAHEHSRGFYTNGADFLTWDRNGHGHAFIGGEWSEVERNSLSLRHNHDHSVDIELTRDGRKDSLLRVPHQADDRTHVAAFAPVECSDPFRLFSDSAHPQYPLYATLKDIMPPASEARLTQATAACYMSGMRRPEDLGDIFSTDSNILAFQNNSMMGHMAQLDLTQPVPSVQQTMQQVQAYDHQQAHLSQQVQQSMAQQQGMQGPMPGMPMH